MLRLLANLFYTATILLVRAQNSEKYVQVQSDGSISAASSETFKIDTNLACRDQDELCGFWSETGECLSNPDYMETNCPVSCGTCDTILSSQIGAEGDHESATIAAIDPEYAERLLEHSLDFGVRQSAIGSDAKGTLERIEETIRYMKDGKTLALPFDVLDNCSNRHELCSFWAYSKECENNKAFMNLNCAPACFSCNLLDMKARCPPLHDAEPAWRPGDLNRMFERIVMMAPGNRVLSEDEAHYLDDNHISHYIARILSSPEVHSPEEISAVVDKSSPPWILSLENFLSPGECDALIELGNKYEFTRSLDLGPQRFDGSFEAVVSDRFTSDEAWCSERLGCRDEEVASRIHERIAHVLEIPSDHSENLMISRFQEAQFHRTHHDFQPHQVDRQCGPRILTLYMFLSDVEAGGGVEFPFFDLMIKPRKGDAILFPNVLNSNPLTKDERLIHQVPDVDTGVQYSATAWIHQFDFLTPHTTGCY